MGQSPRRVHSYLGMLIVLGLFYAALVAHASTGETVIVGIVRPAISALPPTTSPIR
jgi:hypothetical protein